MFVVRSANDELDKSLSSKEVAMRTFVAGATDSAGGGGEEGHLKTVISI